MCEQMEDYFATSTSSFDKDTVWFPYLILAGFLGNAFLYLIIVTDKKL